jgi:polysaccharide biosynthesis protein PslG
MLSKPSKILLMPKFLLITISAVFLAACAAGDPGSAHKSATDTPGIPAVSMTPALATVPPTSSASSAKRPARPKSAASTAVASSRLGTSARAASVEGSAASPSDGGPTSTVYGFSAPELLGWPSAEQLQQLQAMKATGVTSVRVDASWYGGQPNGPSSYDWTSLDTVVGSIQKAGLSADLIIDGCPSWAAVSGAQGNEFAQPASPAAFATWAAAVAARYGGKGGKYFEIWNEPNTSTFWVPKPDPAAYTADLKAAYAAIKKVDPSAIVLTGGLAPAANTSTTYDPITFLTDMYADGAQGSFDGVGLHPYTYPSDPDDTNPGSAWSEMSQTSPSIRSIMAANGDSAEKIYITEFGAPTTGTTQNVSEADQGTELAQAISQVKQLSWIGSFYIYTWEDVPNEGFGLLNVDGTEKPAYSSVVSALAK